MYNSVKVHLFVFWAKLFMMAVAPQSAMEALGFTPSQRHTPGPSYTRFSVVDVWNGVRVVPTVMHLPLSTSLVTSLLLQCDPDQVIRFVLLPSILRAPHLPINPGSPFFVIPELYGRIPEHNGLDYVAQFRREVMKCFSELLLLNDDAIFRSYFEARPLRDFRSPAKHAVAARLYGPSRSPYLDLRATVQVCGPKWIQIVNSLM